MNKPVLVPFALICAVIFSCIIPAHAHHVLGRPAYSLNEDSNTPPSTLVEYQVGDYFVSYMVYPAFPRANEPGRVNLYASRISDGIPFDGEVHFSIRPDSLIRDFLSLFGTSDGMASERGEEQLGSQLIDDGVYRQGFLFFENGTYIVTAKFVAKGEPYSIDLPIRIGEAKGFGPMEMTITLVVCVLIFVSLLQQKKLQRLKMQSAARDSR